jgi:hypothetical protein
VKTQYYPTKPKELNMDFDYEVTLSPDNNDKWHEMLEDESGRKLILEIYKLVVESDRQSVNAIIEKAHFAWKEGSLERQMESFRGLYNASEEMLKDYKF